MKKLVVGTGIVAVFLRLAGFSLVGVIVIAILDSNTRSQISLELTKLLLQFVIIVIIGGVVKMLIDESNRDREHAERLNEFRRALLEKLINAYMGAKRARRLLRARAESVEDYDQQLTIINEIQLELEAIKEQIETAPHAFTDVKNLGSCVESMADYLNQLIEEYENSLPKLREEPPTKTLSGLSELDDFTRHLRTSGFHSKFAQPYHSAVKAIQLDMLKSPEPHTSER